ncbi:MAG: NfeD family protein [Clostridiaceae bacterium]|nr:NfeD family protein [Clostridiaceae bacterium]
MNMLFCTVGIFSFIEGIGTLQAIFLILGLLLLVAEMFTPGFGIAGGSGLLLLIIGIIMTARSPFEAMVMVLILILLVALMLFLILRSAKKGKLARKLILWSAAKHEEGFSTSEDLSQMIGWEGIALTVLRPAGSGDFNGRRLDVVSDGTYIEKDIKIKIVSVEGRRIVVQPVKEQP